MTLHLFTPTTSIILDSSRGYFCDSSVKITTKCNSKRVFATFYSPPPDTADDGHFDPYFAGIRILLHKLLREEKTKTPYCVMVLTTPRVPEWQKNQLRNEGALVQQIDIIPPPEGLDIRHPRWMEQFSKLQLWTMTQFDRIAYLDSDVMLLNSPRSMLESPALAKSPQLESFPRHCDASSCPFAAVEVSGRITFNAGVFILEPDHALYLDMINQLGDAERPWARTKDAEQGLLNYIFSVDGDRPWTPLSLDYNRKDTKAFPNSTTVIGAHTRLWMEFPEYDIKKELQQHWWRSLGRVEGYFQTDA